MHRPIILLLLKTEISKNYDWHPTTDLINLELVWQPSAEFDLGQILPRRTHDSAVGDMIMPLPYVDTVISHPEENPYSLLSTPYSAGSARYAVLRGKRATIGKSDLAERVCHNLFTCF